MTAIINDDYVVGGIEGALGTGFVDGIGRVFGTSSDAHLYMEGGFVGGIALGDVNPKLKPGVTIQEAPFPTINARFGSPVVGGGDLAGAFKDTPEVRALLAYLSSPEAGKIWVSTGAIVSPNKKVPASAYPNVLVRAEAKQVAAAKVFRFDGSDLLPGSLGEDWGTLLQKVIQKPSDIGKLLSDFQRMAVKAFKA
jgi:alpha-glucoside transport system substrate-binding protein